MTTRTKQPPLAWPRSPSRTTHRILGRRLRWTERDKRYRIEKFPDDGDPVFIILAADGDWRPIGHRRTLKAAKAHCHKHHRTPRRSGSR